MTLFKLCLVIEPWAWFTTQNVCDQWGDDWDDCPYDCNCGEPYEWRPDDNKPEYKIKKIAFEACYLNTPCSNNLNSEYSVEQINSREIPWLCSNRYYVDNRQIEIYAGCTYDTFCVLIESANGTVYEPRKQ